MSTAVLAVPSTLTPRLECFLHDLTPEERSVAETAAFYCDDGVSDKGTRLNVAATAIRVLKMRGLLPD